MGQLGQDDASAIRYALSDYRLIDTSKAQELWRSKSILVDQAGTRVARAGAVVGNTVYYDFLFSENKPLAGTFLSLAGIAGPGRGLIYFHPVSALARDWFQATHDARPGVELLAPPPVGIKSDITESSMTDALLSGFGFAEEARSAAARGDLQSAERFLKMKGASAFGMFDKAVVELSILESFGILNEADAGSIRNGPISNLRDAVMESAKTLTDLKDAPILNRVTAYVMELVKSTAANMRSFGDGRFKALFSAYGEIIRHNQSEEAWIKQLEADAASPAVQSMLSGLKVALVKSKAAQAQIEAQMTSAGILVAEARKEAGLGAAPVVLLTIAGKAITLQAVLAVIRFVVIQIILTLVLGAIADAIIAKIRGGEGIAQEAKGLSPEAQNRVQSRLGTFIVQLRSNQGTMDRSAQFADNDPVAKAKTKELGRWVDTFEKRASTSDAIGNLTTEGSAIPKAITPLKPERLMLTVVAGTILGSIAGYILAMKE